MKKFALLAAVCILAVSSIASAQQVPNVTLPDPQGGQHNLASIATAGGLVLCITSPTLKDKGAQEAWSGLLAKARGANKGTFVMVEEMTDAFIKSMALSEMKKDWKPGDVPLLLVDNSSTLHATLGVGKNETVVFAYDKTGKRVSKYAGAPSAAQATAIWATVK